MTVEPQFVAVTRGLEMLLDQLYYWARRAMECREEGSDNDVANRMLFLATENLERFVTTLIECFRGIELTRVPMRTSELVASLARGARAEVGAATVVVREGVEATVVVDPMQLARVWGAVLRRARHGQGALHVRISSAARADRHGVEVVVRTGGAPNAAAADVTVDLEWALARRIIQLHGGELAEEERPRMRTITVFLPTT